MARTPLLVRIGDVQLMEASDPSRSARHLGSGVANRRNRQGDKGGLVLQWQISLDRNGDLCPDYRVMVLVHRSVHRAARVGCTQRKDRPTWRNLCLFS